MTKKVKKARKRRLKEQKWTEVDSPLERNEQTKLDTRLGSEDKDLAELRLRALKHAQRVFIPEEEGGTVPPTPGNIVSNWIQIGPMTIPKGQTYSDARVNVSGRVTSIAVDPNQPNTIYLGAAQGGIWKTTDGGTSWIPKSDNEVSLAIGALALDSTNNILYVGTGEGNFAQDSYYGNGILKSTTGGDSWTLLGANAFRGVRFSRLVINASTPATIFAASSAGLYRSMNSGRDWQRMTSGLPLSASATDVIINPTNPTTAYAAFWGDGIYKTINAGIVGQPTWNKLANGLPATGNFTRIALGLSPSSPDTLYALVTGLPNANPDLSFLINQFYGTTNGGDSWNSIMLPGGNIGKQGFYNLNVAVDPTTPDIVYLSAISLWKAVRNRMDNTWTIADIGSRIHPDNHAFAFNPRNPLVIYAGNDGGIYKSVDGGVNWTDSINKGLCIMQCEFMDQYPTSDAVVLVGTQDNGTEQFRNSPVFYHSDEGDGGFVVIDPDQPNNILHTRARVSLFRSTQGGKFGSWEWVGNGLSGMSLFYPPIVLDRSNSNNAAFGTTMVFLDSAQGAGGWSTYVTLPNLLGSVSPPEVVSAINYVNSNPGLIYAATNYGKVFRLTKTGSTWTGTAIQASPLPARWIWDIITLPNDNNTFVVIMSGFGTAHVWRGTFVPTSGMTTWTDISGTGTGRLPDIPVNALAIEPSMPNTMYIGTDIGVFRTTNGGTTWTQFSDGLPNCAVFDMRIHMPTRLLRVATHGRGIWERKLDVPSMPDVDIFVRDHLMNTGRFPPALSGDAAAFEDPLEHTGLGDFLSWWMCPDIKIDALEGSPPSYQMNVSDVDYTAFESNLGHRNPQRGNINRVYIQIRNRGINDATNVTVKILYAEASAGLPDLPSDFWTAFPGNSSNTVIWHPIGSAQIIQSISSTKPAILEWEWSTPVDAATHSCLLVVTDSTSDPIPTANKVLNVANLVSIEKHVGLKNLHVVNVMTDTIFLTEFQFSGDSNLKHTIEISPLTTNGWKIGLLLQDIKQNEMVLNRVSPSKPTKIMLTALKEKFGSDIEEYDTTKIYMVDKTEDGAVLSALDLPKGILRTILLMISPVKATSPGNVSIMQRDKDQNIIGGSTFVLSTIKK